MGRSRKRKNRDPQRNFKSLDRQSWPNDTTKAKPYNPIEHPKTTAATTAYSYTRYLCDHWQDTFGLLDGLNVYASAWSDRPWGYSTPADKIKQDISFVPDIGFYLDELWTANKIVTTGGFVPPWLEPEPEGVLVSFPWIDRSVPLDVEQFVKVLRWLLGEIKDGKRIDIGCMGGHGRTGTMLACLLVAQGMPANEAVKKVRSEHCSEAIETQGQIAFVQRLGLKLNPDNGDKVTPLMRGTAEVTPNPPLGSAQAILDRVEYEGGWQAPSNVRSPYDDEPGYSDSRHIDYDDEDYETWLRLNTAANVARGMTATQEELDDYCDVAPCLYPNDCDPARGECWIAQTRTGNMGGISSWEECAI